MRRLFTLLLLVAAFLAGGYVFTTRGANDIAPTTTTSWASTTSSTSTSSTSSTTQPPVSTCAADLLNPAVSPTGGGLGNATFQISLQNTGSAPCALKGFVGVRLFDASGVPLPTTVVNSTSGFADPAANHAPTLVTLAIGGKAFADGIYPTVPAGSERTCAIAASMTIGVPQSAPITAPTSMSPCNHGLIRLSPLFS